MTTARSRKLGPGPTHQEVSAVIGSLGVLAGDPADVLAGIAGHGDQFGLSTTLDERGVADGVSQFAAPTLQCRLGAAVGTRSYGDGIGGHRSSVTDIGVATQCLRTVRKPM